MAAAPGVIATLRMVTPPALMLAGLIAGFVLLRDAGFDPHDAVSAGGGHGPLAFVGLGTLACAVGMPRQLVAMAGGYAFGLWPGAALALLAEILGCAVDFAWARVLARPLATRILQRRAAGRMARLDRFLSRRAFTATLTLRLLPVGNNLLLNLAAGVSGVAAAPFLLASLLGYVPQTVIFSLAGTGASVSDTARYAVAGGLLLVSVALGAVLLRHSGAKESPVTPA